MNDINGNQIMHFSLKIVGSDKNFEFWNYPCDHSYVS
jgi:hypothetical protein